MGNWYGPLPHSGYQRNSVAVACYTRSIMSNSTTNPPSARAATLDTPQRIASAVESVLFIAGRSLASDDLRKMLGVSEDALREALTTLAADYEQQGRGVRLQQSGDQVQLVSAPENARYVAALLGMPTHAKLTTAALETLAIIAYRQPITRSQLEAIRSVNSDRALATLVQYSLVMEVGRAMTVGRPALFGTTGEFLQQFGLTSLEALPAAEIPDELAARRTRDAEAIRQAVTSGDAQPPLPLPVAEPPLES